MITLTILNPDNTVYWTECFNTREENDRWLAEEQTRPYWNPDFIVQITDNTAELQAQAQVVLAEQAASAQAQQDRVDQLNALKTKNPLTSEDIQTIISLMLQQLGNP